MLLIKTEVSISVGSAITSSTLSLVSPSIGIVITRSTALLISTATLITNEYILKWKRVYT